MEQQEDLANCGTYFEDLKEETQLMSALVGDLLTFSRTEAGSWDTPLEELEMSSLIASAVRQENLAPHTVKQRVEASLFVMGIDRLLIRALGNLLRNAQKYAGVYGPIEIVGRRDAGEIVIEVNDQGVGLHPEDLKNIFRPFYRPDFARTRDTGGTGLGLAIVKNCVEACNGTVSCRNRAPHGLSVEIRLPKASHKVAPVPEFAMHSS
jgi:two-component system, OmpR family, sensor histidine kinase CpxA